MTITNAALRVIGMTTRPFSLPADVISPTVAKTAISKSDLVGWESMGGMLSRQGFSGGAVEYQRETATNTKVMASDTKRMADELTAFRRQLGLDRQLNTPEDAWNYLFGT